MAGWERCYHCRRKGGAWREGQNGRMYAVTAPERISGHIEEGDEWTCVLCLRLGREQVFKRA